MNDENQTLTIGQKLHDARVAKGYTLDDLQKNTKIQKRYLIAIEDNDFDALPGEFYVRAFVKQYADSVGLDGSELMSEFDNKLPDTEDPEYVDRVNSDNPQTRSVQRKASERSDKFRRYIPIATVSVVVLIILIAIWVAASRSANNQSNTDIQTSKVSVSSSSSKDKNSSSKKESKPAAKKNDTLKIKQASTSGSDVTYNVTGFKTNRVIKLRGTGDASAWVSVTADGSSLFQQSISGTKVQTVKIPSGTSSVVINTGNATATQIYVGNKKLNLPEPTDGSSNQVRNVTLQLGGNSANTNSSSSNSASTNTTTQSTNDQTGTTDTTTGTTGTDQSNTQGTDTGTGY
ncbi:RodZ domain-containing protein [Lentilactobacillus sp. Marseille-Q4993]|uniref:helix-turn-helix domain-containing protein n=1 Tax=Lentilactobacillus sp. Marseille-Q4993 TaxID=3039492 RepID=UPI0024BC76B2|nr:RodZ domain-containing protein [Lentilactobacillus sp. Marseille-Q4993]